MDEQERVLASKLASYTAPKDVLDDVPVGDDGDQAGSFGGSRRIVDRESDYSKRRLQRQLSPSRGDAFAGGSGAGRSYGDALREAQLAREEDNTLRNIEAKQRGQEQEASRAAALASVPPAEEPRASKRSRWDAGETSGRGGGGGAWEEEGGAAGAGSSGSRWDATPARGSWEEGPTPSRRASRWDATPAADGFKSADATSQRRSRWDATPLAGGGGPGGLLGTPVGGASLETPVWGAGMGGATPAYGAEEPMTPEAYSALRVEREVEARNRPLTDAELDALLPGAEDGYRVLEAPPGYVPLLTPARKLTATPSPWHGGEGLYAIPEEDRAQRYDTLPSIEGLPELKPEDAAHFGKLLQGEEEALSVAEFKERRILKLLLKLKNGTPPQRKSALRTLTEKAREFGAEALFDQILPLLMTPTLEDQERHLIVKLIDRILFKLDDAVRPHVHKILVVIEPLLIDEDYTARVEGREIIANLAKAAGLAAMISNMRPDLDHVDEYVRNTTARALAVVGSALGVPALLPFLRAVCASRKSWQARHTGLKVVQQLAILLGCAILPHLRELVSISAPGLADENQKVRTMAALAVSALAESAAPYGIESFDDVLEPLWKGIRLLRGKVLAAYLKAIGHIVPLMDAVYANYYTREVAVVLRREFASPDEEMKRIVLQVVAACVATAGVEPAYVRSDLLPDFFQHYWVRRAALNRRTARGLVDATLALARKAGLACVAERLVPDLKDESEPYRRVVVEAVDALLTELGASEVDARLEEQLVDGVLFAFQEQSADDGSRAVLDAFGTVVTALGARAAPYLPQITGTVKWRLNHRSARVRQEAADLVARVAQVLHVCGEDRLLGHLGVVLFENLGEEYPDVLGALLGALKGVVNAVGMARMTPPVKDLLPRLTPILKNRHERVQENCIDLVGRIADRGAEQVPAREWMRICFELLDTLRAPKKAIRRAAVNTFGYIAKAIGPQDVLVTLLNNLKVQERQNRVCTTVAIAIVAETCAPFTVLPALMNEYRVPELNVQNGVLKALSFLFEYIGEMGRDYLHAVTPLLQDALQDRDLVHRQTAAWTVQHAALGVVGLGCEDAVLHLLNLIWPNVLETTPHLLQAVTGAVDASRLVLGAGVVLNYLLQGLFHPARKVRTAYWRLYNNLYIGQQDALVACYPVMPDLADNTYHRHELDVFV